MVTKNGVLIGGIACYPIKQNMGITNSAPPHTHTHTHAHSRNSETAYVSVNGQMCWKKTGITAGEGTQVCGQNQPKNEKVYPVTGCVSKFSGSGTKLLTVRVWTDLDEPAEDESFGIDNFGIRRELDTTRPPCA